MCHKLFSSIKKYRTILIATPTLSMPGFMLLLEDFIKQPFPQKASLRVFHVDGPCVTEKKGVPLQSDPTCSMDDQTQRGGDFGIARPCCFWI